MATSTLSIADVDAGPAEHASWMPLVVIAMAQILMVFNISTLQVSIDAIASTFNVSATAIGTAIVTYALVVAAFILLGARVAQIYGSRRVFRATVLLFGVAMALMSLSFGRLTMLGAQVAAGAAAAALVPSLVALIAANYRGAQQAKALGWLGGAQAAGVVLAFLVAGALAAWPGWRFTFGLLALFALAIYKLGDKLADVEGDGAMPTDWVGVALAAAAVVLISVGANNLTDWGMLLARPDAPFSVLDMSPAPLMIVAGVFLGQGFVWWSRLRQSRGKKPLAALEVIESSGERAALFAIFLISALASAITFLIPLYVQVVQGRSSLDTALAIIPVSLASFAAAVLIVRLLGRLGPRTTARYAFLLVAIGVAFLGAVIRNDWSDAAVLAGMLVIGFGEGALITLLFNVLVTAVPKELAGDVGSLRGVTNNLGTGVGTAVAGALVVALLGTTVHRELVHNEWIPAELKVEIHVDRPAFVSNDQLVGALAATDVPAEAVEEAVRINTELRLVALKVPFFTLAAGALLAFFPAGALPAALGAPVPAGAARRRRAPPEQSAA